MLLRDSDGFLASYKQACKSLGGETWNQNASQVFTKVRQQLRGFMAGKMPPQSLEKYCDIAEQVLAGHLREGDARFAFIGVDMAEGEQSRT
jgi:flagellar biosynthesis protein FliP